MKKLLSILMSVALAIGVIAPQQAMATPASSRLLVADLFPSGMNRLSQSLRYSGTKAAFYQLASNRFGIPTDAVANATGYLANTSNQQGNGTAAGTPYGTHQFRRWAFDTFADATPATPGVFLWGSGVQLVGGVYDPPTASTGFMIEEVDIRSQANPSVIVATLTFSGNKAAQITPGSQVFNDPITNMPAGSYYADVDTQVDANGALPVSSPLTAYGEYGRNSSFSADNSFATGTAPTGAPTSNVAGTLASLPQGLASYGPMGFFVKTSAVIPNALIWADSREDRTNVLPDLLDGHGDFGAMKISLSKTSTGGGRMAWLDAARYSNNLTGAQPTSPTSPGITGRGVFKYFRDAFYNAFGQTRSPFNLVFSGEGVNSLNVGNLSAMQGAYTNAVGYARALWPNIPWVQETILPFTTTGVASPYLVNTNDAQTSPGVTAAATTANGGYLDSLNSWIASGGGGLFNLGVDVATSVRSASYYQSWKNETKTGTLRGYPGNLGSGVPANTTSTITLDFAPDAGAALAIDVGTSTVETVNWLAGTPTVNTTNAAYYDVPIRKSGQNGGLAQKVVQAHANGITVTQSSTPDGLHQSHKRIIGDIAPAIDAQKSTMRSLAAGYTGS